MSAARSYALPPPIGGWDTSESVSDMPEDRALILDNWFPGTDKLTVRRGYAPHVSAIPGRVETLLEYTTPGGVNRLFAAAQGRIYDVTSQRQEVPDPEPIYHATNIRTQQPLHSDRWQYATIGNTNGYHLLAVNGVDPPLHYNGTRWKITELDTRFNWTTLHHERLWFGKIHELSAWYLDLYAIAGNAKKGYPKKFDLGSVARRGGHIVAMGSWTRDSGAGMDDLAVFFTSQGEALIYSGTSPNQPSTWGLIGVFQVGAPIGPRCMIRAGADLILITQEGFLPLSTMLSMGKSHYQAVALSKQIAQTVNRSSARFAQLFGWQAILYPKRTMLLFNVPQTATTAHQYVFNTLTGAAARFTGINAACFGRLRENLYWGGDGAVYQFDAGHSDNGSPIRADALQAFSYFKTPRNRKIFKLAQPIIESNGHPTITLDMLTDFDLDARLGPVQTPPPITQSRWNRSRWNRAVWGRSNHVFQDWYGIRGVGRAGAVRFRIVANTYVAWLATNVEFTVGNRL